MTTLNIPSLQDQVSPEEWQLRCDLAAAYRLVALHGWSDLVFTHISARLPGPDHHFLINPYGLLFEEITASSLIRIDQGGNKLQDSPFPVNPAGFTIHSAVHAVREDAQCVLHTHTRAGRGGGGAEVRRAADLAAEHLRAGLAGVPRLRGRGLPPGRAAAPAGGTWAAPTSCACATTGC